MANTSKKLTLAQVITLARKVYRENRNPIDPIRVIRENYPARRLKDAKNFWDWLSIHDGAAFFLASQWCEEHWCESTGAHFAHFHAEKIRQELAAPAKPETPKFNPNMLYLFECPYCQAHLLAGQYGGHVMEKHING